MSELGSSCGMSIVIVDDNPGSLDYLSSALAATGLEVFTASGAEQALELVSLHHPQIVLSDLVMPDQSGLDLLRQVREFDASISVVLMSAQDASSATAKAIKEAGTGYLKKPISLSVLRDCIRQIVQCRRRGNQTS